MATKDTLFTSAGITTHSRAGVTVTKVRYGTDHIRLIKMLSSNKKISVSKHPDDRGDGFLDAVRVEILELPTGMLKADAAKFLAAHALFQSAEDQALLADELEKRAPKVAKVRVPKAPKVVKPAISLDSIKSRPKKSTVTAEQIVAALVTE